MFDAIRHESSAIDINTVFPCHRGQPESSPAKAGAIPAFEERRFGSLFGASAAMRKLFSMMGRVAASDAAVMIVGESGSGKELVARTLHDMSGKAGQRFVAINCGALPATLIESELFGYEKGAFTGAYKTHAGFFERADGGTLFLDEVTEMPVDMQVRLLRVLDSGTFTRVGGDLEMHCNVRVLSATNRDPLTAVRIGLLREDLLYRLAVFPLVLPPLRERDDDVVLLAERFLFEMNRQNGTQKVFAVGVKDKLHQHPWPGNVRELKNCIQRAYILSDIDIDIDTLMPFKPCGKPCSRSRLEFEVGSSLGEAERQIIFATLERYRGDKRRTATVLGVSLKTLYNRLNEYAADESRFDDVNTDKEARAVDAAA